MNDMAVQYTQHRFTVDEYHRMGEAGIFASSARIELVDGELIERLVHVNPAHAQAVTFLTKVLTLGLGDRAILRCQLPVTLGDLSEPEPDFSIVLPPRSRYHERHPGPDDLISLIEVADSSRAFDLRKKVPLYALFGVPEVWVVDLVDRAVNVFRDVRDGIYRESTVATADDTVAVDEFPDIALHVGDIFS